MATFAICWWTIANPHKDDSVLIQRFRETARTTPLDQRTTKADAIFGAGGVFDARLTFADANRGRIFVDRSEPEVWFTNGKRTMGGCRHRIGIMIDFPNDADAVHYRLMFSDEPYEKDPPR